MMLTCTRAYTTTRHALMLVLGAALLQGAPCLAQDPQALLLDTTAAYTSPGSTAIPTGSLSAFHFPTNAQDNQQSLATHPQRFAAVTCNYPLYSTAKAPTVYNISFGNLYTPEGTKDYAVHSTLLQANSINETGSNPGTDPAVFKIYSDNWLNLRTGVLTALNYTDNLIRQGGMYVFDPKLAGQPLKYGKICWPVYLLSILVNSTSTLQTSLLQTKYISPQAFYGASNNTDSNGPLTHYLYPPPEPHALSANDTDPDFFRWITYLEDLRFDGGFVAMQATRGPPCTPRTEGFYELVPLLNYLTHILQEVFLSNETSVYANQLRGQLNGTYVLTSPSRSSLPVATLKYPDAYLPVEEPIGDPFVGMTESQCILQAKNYTMTEANVDGIPPANVWNFCATGTCNYTFPNGTSGQFISPFAAFLSSSVCQLGYSNAVDNSEYVVPANIQSPGVGSTGRFTPDRPYLVRGPIGIRQTSSSTYKAEQILPQGLGHAASPYGAGALNA